MIFDSTFGKIKLLGRAYIYKEMVGLSFSASGIEFICEDGFTAVLKGDNMVDAPDADIHFARFAVFSDGEIILDRRLEKRDEKIEISKAGRHVFRILKLSESDDSTMYVCRIEAKNGEKVEAPAEKEKKIEFIGDSITCGYGVEGCGKEEEIYTTATENATKAYAYLTAQKLGWDWSLVSKSGAGIISGYTPDGKRNRDNLLPQYYESVGCSMLPFEDGTKPADIRWSFSFKPDLIVINLGTNDKSYCRPDCGISSDNIEDEDILDCAQENMKAASGLSEQEKKELMEGAGKKLINGVYDRRGKLFRTTYIDFLKTVRKNNPQSYIICSLGIMEDAINSEVINAMKQYSEQTGDSRIEWFEFEKHDIEKDGIGTHYHPSAKTHEDRAGKLYEHILTLNL